MFINKHPIGHVISFLLSLHSLQSGAAPTVDLLHEKKKN